MKHVIDGVCGALPVFAPLQDGHGCGAGGPSASTSQSAIDRLQALERIKPTLRLLLHTSQPFLSSSLFRRELSAVWFL